MEIVIITGVAAPAGEIVWMLRTRTARSPGTMRAPRTARLRGASTGSAGRAGRVGRARPTAEALPDGAGRPVSARPGSMGSGGGSSGGGTGGCEFCSA